MRERLSSVTTFGQQQWLMLLLGLAIGVILLLVAGGDPKGAGPSILREAGIVTLGTVAVSLVYDIILRPAQVEHIQSAIEKSLIVNARDYGLSKIGQLDFIGLFDRLEEGEELWWLDTFCPDMDKEDVQDAMRRVLKRGAILRMLVIQPDSQAAVARAAEIKVGGFDPDSFQSAARRHLKLIEGMKVSLPEVEADRLHIATYAGLPCAPMYLRIRGRQQASDWTTGLPLEGWTSYFLRWPTYEAAHVHWSRPQEGKLPPLRGLGLDAFCKYFGDKWQREADATVG
jgi:hypothetical protein